MDEELKYLINQLKKDSDSGLTLVNKSRREYLTKKDDLETSVYILIEGTVITSLTGLEKQYNFSYLNQPEIVTILGTEEDSVVEQSFDILVDSSEANFYKVNRKYFWRVINGDLRLGKYIRNYYRKQVQFNTLRLQQQLSNNRKGQICAFLYEAKKLFGVESPQNKNYILIDHKITHGNISKFVGMSQRSAVTRIMTELSNEKIIENNDGYITIKNLDYLEQYAKELK